MIVPSILRAYRVLRESSMPGEDPFPLKTPPEQTSILLPDHPKFRLAGMSYQGRPVGVDQNSDGEGALRFEFGRGYFTWFKLSILDLPPEKLRIRYRCAYRSNAGGPPQVSSTYENLEQCPPE